MKLIANKFTIIKINCTTTVEQELIAEVDTLFMLIIGEKEYCMKLNLLNIGELAMTQL